MAEDPQRRKIPLIFFRVRSGQEPVREWLKEVAGNGAPCDRKGPVAGAMAVASRDAAMPPAGKRTMGGPDGPATKRTARVLLCHYREHLVALHGFIKKTRTTPADDLALARKRQKELER
jgi:Phage derived protein Gp49-like (DUF891)